MLKTLSSSKPYGIWSFCRGIRTHPTQDLGTVNKKLMAMGIGEWCYPSELDLVPPPLVEVYRLPEVRAESSGNTKPDWNLK